MMNKNFEMLRSKIQKMLLGWSARRLSLLGRILIYKTFGLSQVIYVLTAVELTDQHYGILNKMFLNFIWGRNTDIDSTRSRISKLKLCTPINMGGFGMIEYMKVMDGIHCR